jgi:hypothetical protein
LTAVEIVDLDAALDAGNDVYRTNPAGVHIWHFSLRRTAGHFGHARDLRRGDPLPESVPHTHATARQPRPRRRLVALLNRRSSG